MDRKEAYAQIKKLGLAEDVKKKFGKNFTQVSTTDLVAMIEGAKKPAAKKAAPVAAKKDTKKVEELRGAMEGTVDYKAKYEEAVKVIAKFLAFMPEELLNDAAAAAKTLTPEKVVKDVEFSSADIDKMFRK
jgi:hypothetical protein